MQHTTLKYIHTAKHNRREFEMKKLYEAPSVEITAFKSEEIMDTTFASAITIKSNIADAVTDLSIDF